MKTIEAMKAAKSLLRWHHFGDCRASADPLPTPAYVDKLLTEAIAAEEAQKVAVPQGWKLVPIEPTLEMLNAVDEYVGGSCYSCSKREASDDDCERVYKAMLATAPQTVT